MATVFLTAAATRGTVRFNTATEGFPLDPWTVDVRDGLGFGAPQAQVNANNTGAINVTDTYTSGLDLTSRRCSRFFMAFDTSSITETVQSATLWVFRQTAGASSGDFIPVKATAPTVSTNIANADYDAIFQYETGYPMDSNTVGNVVDYANAPITFWPLGWNAIPLNGTALTDINALSELQIALVNYTYDYLYQEPTPGSPGTNVGNGINSFTNPPYLEIETGVGQYVLSINPNLTSNVNNAATANIKFVNRVGVMPVYRWDTGGVASSSNPGCSGGVNRPYVPIYTQNGISAVNGDIVYTDAAGTALFNGGGLYWVVDASSNNPFYSGQQWQITSLGVITDTSQYCLF
jgi:hypothetical protein